MKATLNSMVDVFQDNSKSRSDKSFYGKVISTIVKDNKIVGYNVEVGDSTVEARKLAGAEVGNTVLLTTLSNGATVVTGTLNGDTDAIVALDTANNVRRDTFEEDTYTDGTHTVYKAESGGSYYYYWIDSLGQERIVQESELEKDAQGNLVVHTSLSSQLEKYQASNDGVISTIQTDINNRTTFTDVSEQIAGQEAATDEKIAAVVSQISNVSQQISQAQQDANKYDNYLQYDSNNGLQVGYRQNNSKVKITGDGIELFSAQGEKSIDIQTSLTTIPNMASTYLYFGNYLIQYKPSTDEIVCRRI